jgi:hypothetical protein
MNPGEFSVRNDRVLYVAMLFVIVGGLVAYRQMGRLEDPEFTIKEALIITPYPQGQRRRGRQGGHRPDRKGRSAARPDRARRFGVLAQHVRGQRRNPGPVPPGRHPPSVGRAPSQDRRRPSPRQHILYLSAHGSRPS